MSTPHPASPAARRAVVLGVIGGSGLYAIDGLENVREVALETPFGAPSGKYTIGELARDRQITRIADPGGIERPSLMGVRFLDPDRDGIMVLAEAIEAHLPWLPSVYDSSDDWEEVSFDAPDPAVAGRGQLQNPSRSKLVRQDPANFQRLWQMLKHLVRIDEIETSLGSLLQSGEPDSVSGTGVGSPGIEISSPHLGTISLGHQRPFARGHAEIEHFRAGLSGVEQPDQHGILGFVAQLGK